VSKPLKSELTTFGASELSDAMIAYKRENALKLQRERERAKSPTRVRKLTKTSKRELSVFTLAHSSVSELTNCVGDLIMQPSVSGLTA
jgi:hypothetical protein